jgi:hypothetical protein
MTVEVRSPESHLSRMNFMARLLMRHVELFAKKGAKKIGHSDFEVE